jgi:hypothetical protein
MMMNDVRLSRMTALAEMMAAAALLSACGGGGSAPDPAVDAQQVDGVRTALAVKNSSIGQATTLPTGYVKCADEWGQTTCNFSGSAVLYYGAASSYYFKSVTGPFNCSSGNWVLGDPLQGVAKACYIPGAPAPAPGPRASSRPRPRPGSSSLHRPG